MMQGNTLHGNGYQPVKLYICLQIAKCKVPQPRVGQYHFTELSQVHYMNHFDTRPYINYQLDALIIIYS